MHKIYFDSQRCLGCHACEFACTLEHSENRDPHQVQFEAKLPITRRRLKMKNSKIAMAGCRNCEPAPCVEACIPGAMSKDTGWVQCDVEKCDACGQCVIACPFDAVRIDQTVAIKCDLCPHKEGTTACVEACPTGALILADPGQYKEEMRRRREIKKKVKP